MEDGKFEYLSAVDGDPGNLIKGLQMVQSREGYVSDDAVKAVSEHFSTPVVEVEGVLGFYAQFKRVRPGKYRISMCDGTACHIKGAPLVREWLRQELGIDSGETTDDGMFSLETVACLGCCSLAPVISVNGRVHAKLTRKSLASILAKYRKEASL